MATRSPHAPSHGGPTLLFDGDDTLWGNNHHFEQAIEAFVAVVRGGAWTDDAIRAELDRIEERGFPTGVVGTAAFGRNMREAATGIVTEDALAPALERIDAIVAAMSTSGVELLDDVAATLDVLGRTHALGLVTRGEPAEQWAKIDASGLGSRFARIAVVEHKTEATYRRLVTEWGLDPDATWMIGNSPRSDVLPARAAGLRAVHVRHGSTWRLEHARLDPADQGVIVLDRFADLLEVFASPLPAGWADAGAQPARGTTAAETADGTTAARPSGATARPDPPAAK
jgi:putative hydrolase of the HAD superfamily